MKAKVGQWVVHRGTQYWAEVLEVKDMHDGTTENRVRIHPAAKEDGPPGQGGRETWWASYHIAHVRNDMPPKAWGITQLDSEKYRYVGYHEHLPFKKGDRVRIKKDTLIRSMYPKDKGSRIAKRTYVITVHHTMSGSCYVEDGKEITTNPTVCWPGPSGYWQEVDINDVEKVFE